MIATAVLAPDRAGTPCGVQSSGFFRGRLNRQLAKHLPLRKRRERDLSERNVRLDIDDAGIGSWAMTGDGARMSAAHLRITRIARRLRREGDSRTVAQLTADIGLDLLLRGATPDLTERYGTELPTARVHLTVSLATVLGLSTDPGLLTSPAGASAGGWIPAEAARAVAYAAGSTWRRLLTDPVTGLVVAVDQSDRPAPAQPDETASYVADVLAGYRPRAATHRLVVARDGVCRAPGCMIPAEFCDLDHDVDWYRGGATVDRNLSAKHRRHHNHKTRGWWRTSHDPVTHALTWTLSTGRQITTYPGRAP